MPRAPHPSRKKFTRFASKQPFQFGLPNVSPALTQASDNSPIYVTRTTSLLRRQVLANAPGVKIKSDSYRFQVLPRDSWGEPDFSRKSVLFLIPDDALGDCVGMALFFRALKQKFKDIRIGVLNAGSASDIFALVPDIEIFQLFISSTQLKRFDHVIDLSEMEGWRDIATMPVNPEEALCEAFGIPPIPLEERHLPTETRLKIGIVPMASSPLRTLPPKLISEITAMLSKQDYEITIVLNAYQGVMKAYKTALGALSGKNIRILEGFKTIGDLVTFVGQQDYLVVADSGPAHISKLFQTPGFGIYSSADAKTLQGRHKNLRVWQSDFEGPHCTAPCGLAKLRATPDGKIGCMGSLDLPISALPDIPEKSDPHLARALITDTPVPCVAKLHDQRAAIATAIAQDLGLT
ncbi:MULTISPECIES: glycosyltransferase family 9 protein [Thalassospira]|uniref:Heptosyltransferase n=1 Tax=Thalassospira profundimaris TaxID=502049 RepID=A0A367VIB0_9PROT|nr:MULTISPECIES: glycosyltransferase family 9 protein [Thalassospira]KZB71493.1 heptosyltransferase [Thalassospira sp. MCCC 1A01148]MBR9898775.1 glycosyltransferase family 9 protein [Rhodospirillales bacterium]RCK24191.1 heptosyltransferase [Thalassospira profundimaris]